MSGEAAHITRAELPTDRQIRSATAGGRAELEDAFDSACFTALAEFTNDKINSLLAAGLAGFEILLYKYTQQHDLWIDAWAQGEVGSIHHFVHGSLSDEVKFSDVVGQVMQSFVVNPVGAQTATTPNVRFGIRHRCNVVEPKMDMDDTIDLALVVEILDAQAILKLSYRSDLFHRGRMQVLLQHYKCLMRDALTTPAKRLGDLRLCSEADCEMIPDPTGSIDQPRSPVIAELVMDWARRAPDAPAIHQGGNAWTYAQLASSSADIAAELHHLGMQAGDVVAVTGQRSFALVSAMLGVFRGGYVLVTLDPKMPTGRRQTMLEQSRARAVVFIGVTGAEEEIRAASEQKVLVDAETAMVLHPSRPIALLGSATALPAISPEQGAYVFFTSGSTGVPKAVMGCHKGLSHFLCWQRREFDIQPTDRAAQLTALSFDVVLRDVFLALVSGASLCIPDEADVIDPARILTWLEREQVSVLHVVPSLARLWLNHMPEGFRLPRLRRVFFAGEPLLDTLVLRAYGLCGVGAEIINLYGPTETTLAKCFYRVPREPDAGVQPIGQPLPQTQVLILDKQRRLCGAGEIGEIAIRTPFRTRGYLNAAELNAKVFIPNPFRDDPDDLLYLTGDNGRYRWDGVLEILGRIDNQIKIRGVRIEPGEVETAIGRHPEAREVVVVAREDVMGSKILVAYVVLRRSDGEGAVCATCDDLREFSRGQLPETMVPSAFVVLPVMPLNANGKVDKKSLPAPDRASMIGTLHAAPTDALEDALAGVWQRILRLDQIGIDDQFFDIGGHSLLAVQLVHTISTSLSRPCTLPMLYSNGTIRSLAAAMRQDAVGAGKEWTLLALQPSGKGIPLFCISGVHLYSELAREFAPDIPVYGIFLTYEQDLFRKTADHQGPRISIEAIAAYYLRAVRDVQPNGPYCLVGVSFGGVVAYQMAQQLLSEGEKVEFLGLLDTMLLSTIKRNWIKWLGASLRHLREGGWRHVLDRVKRRLAAMSAKTVAGANASDVGPESEMQRFDAIRARMFREAERRYQPRPYPGAAVLARAEVRFRHESDLADPVTYGWSALIPRLETFDVPGDHLGILRKPHVKSLASKLRPHLDRARNAPTCE